MTKLNQLTNTLAIAMWDYSYMERTWDGAGYQDIDKALDEFVLRGYNAVRIDAYPHFVHNGNKQYGVIPARNQQDYGSPIYTKITVQPYLNNFIKKCQDRGVLVALSTWWALDDTNVYMQMNSPEAMAEAWLSTLRSIDEPLLDNILYLDISNEFPLKAWTPFWEDSMPRGRYSENIQQFMKQCVQVIKHHYPTLPITFSEILLDNCHQQESYLDLIDSHMWMSGGEFYQKINYNYEKFSDVGYRNLQQYGEKTYRADEQYWQQIMLNRIDQSVQQATAYNKPLVCTEGFALVQYKDFPLLNWNWILELNEIAVKHAVQSQKFYAINTSNFCQPQFVGMWKEIEWHQKLTSLIKSTTIK